VQVACCQSRGKTTREFLKKKARRAGVDTELASSKTDWFELSEPYLRFDREFTQADIRRIDDTLSEAASN
jgi:hypothetical protein